MESNVYRTKSYTVISRDKWYYNKGYKEGALATLDSLKKSIERGEGTVMELIDKIHEEIERK